MESNYLTLEKYLNNYVLSSNDPIKAVLDISHLSYVIQSELERKSNETKRRNY
jgi:hypothetical protein